MRRAVLVLALACSALALGIPARAATWPVSQQHSLAALVRGELAAHRATITHRASLVKRDNALNGVAAAPADQTGTQLRVPPSAFSPATINSSYDYAEQASDADQDWFSGNHSTKYENLGFVTGYYERADYQNTTDCKNSSGSTFICFHYQGTAYGSAAQATAAYQDGVSATQKFSSISPQDCTSNGIPCTLLGYSNQDGSVEAYAILRVNQCLAEIAATAPPSVFSNDQTMIAQTTQNIANAATQVLQAACTSSSGTGTGTGTGTGSSTPTPTPTPTQTTVVTQPDFSIDSVSIHKDNNDSSTPIKKVKKGTTFYFFIDWTLRAIPSGVKPKYAFKATLKGKVAKKGSFAGTLSSYPPNGYVTYWGLKLSKVGTYKFAGTVTISGHSHTASTSLKVTK